VQRQLAIIAFEDGRYSEAAERLSDDIPNITDLFSRRTLSEPRMKVFTVVRHYDTAEKPLPLIDDVLDSSSAGTWIRYGKPSTKDGAKHSSVQTECSKLLNSISM
jgi:hypothetical protein